MFKEESWEKSQWEGRYVFHPLSDAGIGEGAKYQYMGRFTAWFYFLDGVVFGQEMIFIII